MSSRAEVVKLIQSWIGKKESNGTHKSIIDIYNNHKPLARGYKVKYTDAWCATTVSAVAIKLGYTNIIPLECSCYYLIESAKRMGIWVENDAYIAKEGDIMLYDWQDNGVGDNKGTPDHVGYVTYVNKLSGYYKVTEGNYNDAVKERTVSINGKFIRGFITPKYSDNSVAPLTPTVGSKDTTTIAREVIAGIWGSGEARKNNLIRAGYDYNLVQAKVNDILNGNSVKPSNNEPQDQGQPVAKKITATCVARYFDKRLAKQYVVTASDGLYMRNDAGTNKKALCKIPKNTKVSCYGYYNVSSNIKWYLVQVTIDGVLYTGFCHSAYLR